MKYTILKYRRKPKNICPGVLLEVGFLSNREEAEHSRKKAGIRV
ncbi:hypothetical protein V5097_05200 [Arenibacter palladensis]